MFCMVYCGGDCLVKKLRRWCPVSRKYEVCFGLCEVAVGSEDSCETVLKLCPVRGKAVDVVLNR